MALLAAIWNIESCSSCSTHITFSIRAWNAADFWHFEMSSCRSIVCSRSAAMYNKVLIVYYSGLKHMYGRGFMP